MSQPVVGLPVSFDSYIRKGWSLVAIPPMTKGPKTKDWNKKENVITNSSLIPNGFGVGLAHAYSGTMALDIDNLDDSIAYLAGHGIDLMVLLNAPDAVTIDSGNGGHAKLLYAMPEGLVLNSKKLINTRADGSRYDYMDFRCANSNGTTVQDVIPPSIHPTTLRPYQWGGRGKWESVPQIPFGLLLLWQSLLAEDAERTIKVSGSVDASWDEIRGALDHISPDVSRDEWLKVAMALHHAGTATGQLDAAYSLFNEWSAQGFKYAGERDINAVWRSFKADHGITIGTLFHIAKEHGWSRPVPDASEMFNPTVTPTEPEKIVNPFSIKPIPPKLDFSLFPELLSRRANELAFEMGCDPVVPLIAGLSTICAAADARARLKVTDSWSVPPIAWFMVIGDSGDKKSPGARAMHSILRHIENGDTNRYQSEMLMWKGHEARHSAQMKAYQQHYTSADVDLVNALPPTVNPLPPEPKELRITVSDVTSQKLAQMAEGRPRGFLMELDEMENWIRGLTDKKSPESRATWIDGYETKYNKRVDRITSGTYNIEHFGVAIYGNIQPAVFANHMSAASEDGLLQRFLPVTINSRLNALWNEVPEYLTSKCEFEEMVKSVFALPTAEYMLSDQAKAEFRDFSAYVIELVKAERLLNSAAPYITSLGKADGNCLRLALIFHLMNRATADHIDGSSANHVGVDTMRQAIACMRRFFIPSLRFTFCQLADEDNLANWVRDYIVQNAGVRQTITLSEIRRAGKRQVAGKHPQAVEMELRFIMEGLQDAQYVAVLDDGKHPVYQINPALATIYADYRHSIIAAKLLARQTAYDTVERATGKRPQAPIRVIGMDSPG